MFVADRDNNGTGRTGLVAGIGRLNRTGVFLGTLLVVLAALFTPGWFGVVLLVLLAAAMLTMFALTWRSYRPADRRRRLVMVMVLLAVMVIAAARKLA